MVQPFLRPSTGMSVQKSYKGKYNKSKINALDFILLYYFVLVYFSL